MFRLFGPGTHFYGAPIPLPLSGPGMGRLLPNRGPFFGPENKPFSCPFALASWRWAKFSGSPCRPGSWAVCVDMDDTSVPLQKKLRAHPPNSRVHTLAYTPPPPHTLPHHCALPPTSTHHPPSCHPAPGGVLGFIGIFLDTAGIKAQRAFEIYNVALLSCVREGLHPY